MNRRMKRFLCVLAVAMLALTACEGFDINDLLGGNGGSTDEPTTYEISVEPLLLQFGAEGGEKEVEIEANVDFELLCEAEWVSYQVTENALLERKLYLKHRGFSVFTHRHVLSRNL